MRKRGRVWRVGKWMALAMSVVSTVVFLASKSNLFQARMTSGKCFMLAGGELIYVDYSKSSKAGNPEWRGPIGFSIRSDTFFWGLHFRLLPRVGTFPSEWGRAYDPERGDYYINSASYPSIEIPAWPVPATFIMLALTLWWPSIVERWKHPGVPKPSRTRRIAKWTGLVATSASVLVWACSVLLTVGYNGPEASSFSLARGRIEVTSRCTKFLYPMVSGLPGDESQRIHAAARTTLLNRMASQHPTGWYVRSGPGTFGMARPYRVYYRTIYAGVPLQQTIVQVALWFPTLLVGLVTSMLWYRDRPRIPEGHCGRCGYDLTKNESGVCPECGMRFARTAEDSR